RFENGEVWDLARLYDGMQPGSPSSKGDADGPLVLPGTGEGPDTDLLPAGELERPGLLLRLGPSGADFDPNADWALTLPLPKHHDAQILPGLLDDDFLVGKDADQPLILPGDELSELVPDGGFGGREWFGGESDRMLTLMDDGGLPDGLLRQTDGLDDWMM